MQIIEVEQGPSRSTRTARQIELTLRGNTWQARYAGNANCTFGDTANIAMQRLVTGPATYGAFQNYHAAMEGKDSEKSKGHPRKRKEKKRVEKDSSLHQ